MERHAERSAVVAQFGRLGCLGATWAAKNLPARLDVLATAKLLGFAEHDVQILMAVGKLTPLGDPAPNAPKWFAAVEMIRLAAHKDWRHKRERRQSPLPASRPCSLGCE
jgi:hypothetical protein